MLDRLFESLAPKLDSVTHFEDVPDLAAALAGHAGAGDAVLLKGSRAMQMERVWQALEARAGKKP